MGTRFEREFVFIESVAVEFNLSKQWGLPSKLEIIYNNSISRLEWAHDATCDTGGATSAPVFSLRTLLSFEWNSSNLKMIPNSNSISQLGFFNRFIE